MSDYVVREAVGHFSFFFLESKQSCLIHTGTSARLAAKYSLVYKRRPEFDPK